MLIETYRNPNKPVYPITQYSGRRNKTEVDRAAERGLTVEEYRNRVSAVSRAYALCSLKKNDIVYPHNEEEYEKYGKLRVSFVCCHYDDYGSVQWNDPPYILSAFGVEDPSKVCICTAQFLQKEKPAYLKEDTHE